MKRSIFFVHIGSSEVARYAVLQAVSLGLDVNVVSDKSWASVPGITFFDVAQYASATNSFREVYRHASINHPDYERFCFERWFVILQIAKERNLSNFYYADSDLLVFPGAFDADFESRFVMFDTAWFNFFRNYTVLEAFCDYLLRLYAKRGFVELAQKYAINGTPHLSDMHCFFEYAALNQHVVAPLSAVGTFLGFSERFSLVDNVVPPQRCPFIQEIHRGEAGLYYRMKGSDNSVNVRTLHFQGRSKPFIAAYHDISDMSLQTHLVPLSDWYVANDLLSHSDCKMMNDVLHGEIHAGQIARTVGQFA
ncbi:hypothetical protein [Methylobacterium sp. NEAU K]|uniref:hypothetical protein n=1 Tax=Methylobacterium sp. NEAU K TaxID=3064946 RepID=UPI002735E890|nr:hypothetical protein [Methylobacterium sp. NEAU K]MDP4002716.1 hypothetical protein [Methylobacterium sp. NEAU K]